ncbi:tetratricopeptide repeat protein [Pantoea sp. SOD02]|uniref:tetratricopeptide repeat protein n=1 Tax=Pantoea sp. SOD02 TaxID=2970818 RepID=UPI0021584ABE|nr:tetratricopeptide repeat protein [Pantoea sp. SOD02]UVC28090.1 sel1 repeat family protein [Pantoea sp. SOD02]
MMKNIRINLLITAFALTLLSGCYSPITKQTATPHPLLLIQFDRQLHETQQHAEAGQLEAQQRYGRWLVSAGKTTQAEPLLRAASDNGQHEAQYQLGMLLQQSNPQESKHWLVAAAERGHIAAQQQLSRESRQQHDLLQAFNWALFAAQQGDAAAQNDVGAAYSRGVGVNKNPALALTWYRKAADQDFALAQFNLAGAYQAGEGVPVQPALAYAWYEIASKNRRDEPIARMAEKMKLRMYAEASRTGKAALARQQAQKLNEQFNNMRAESAL